MERFGPASSPGDGPALCTGDHLKLNYPCCGVGGDGVDDGGEEIIFENAGEKVPTCCGKGRCCFYTKVRLFSFFQNICLIG